MDIQWPMADYMNSWKTFRSLGNEPQATSEHILSLPLWPKKDDLRILDIGCGDGRMLGAFISRAKQSVSQVILLDPEQPLLSEASQQIEDLGLGAQIITKEGVADQEGLLLGTQVDVGLAVHLVYLMPHSRFRKLVTRWPVDVPLYIVLDAPDSVFSELWAGTAPEYATRSAAVHAYLSKEANGGLEIKRTDFVTSVRNPLKLDSPIRERVLSLLCYCEFEALPVKRKKNVEDTIRAFSDNGDVKCACTCYELLRSANSDL